MEGKIEINDFEVSLVEAMLRFMYSFEYSNTCGISAMIYDAQVYQIADKYDIPALKKHAKERFETAVGVGWNMDDFPLAIGIVYDTTPRRDMGLRDIVVKTSVSKISELLDKDGFSKTLRSVPDFAVDLIPALVGKKPR